MSTYETSAAPALHGEAARLAFGAIFTDHMVLQRERDIPVWGYGPARSAVEVSFGGLVRRGRVGADGRWAVRLNPGAASAEGRRLAVRLVASGQAAALEDVLVGDVWFCSGQSNMELGLASAADSEREVAGADFPLIRLFLIHKTSAPAPVRTLDARWKLCTPEAVAEHGWGGFSAVGYHFGRRIHQQLGVPVGLIQAAYGGSKVQPFIDPACMAGDPVLEAYRQEIAEADEQWRAALAQAGLPAPEEAGAPGMELHPFAPFDQWDTLKPASAWNAMVHPLLPFAVRGVLWYQGESDVGLADTYELKMRALIAGFRHSFGSQRTPVYFAQIAPWAYDGNSWQLLELWQAQYAAARAPLSGIVTTVDVGDMDDIHPTNKRPVGERFAALALAKTYGRADVPAGGPELRSVRFRRGGAVLRFSTFQGAGLRTADGAAPLGFELAGADGVFHPAQGALEGETVVLSCLDLALPSRVRHAWQVGVTPNLTDESGVPALPFSR
ncbi:sialate O-acetylesterase [Chloroflexia bacterium SDU3-3]|nr:sialate O-acetylesterase [Chloroflexia bacterium SDU3-3]